MKISYKSSKADWIYEVLTKDVSTEYIIKGLFYWYIKNGLTISNVMDDMHFRSFTFNNVEDIKAVRVKIKAACEAFTAEED